jgi:hypothetical protein
VADEEHRTADELVRDAVKRYLQNRRLEQGPHEADTPSERPIWEVITEIAKNIPDEVFDRLPRDGASQVDHYIYGLPKRDE